VFGCLVYIQVLKEKRTKLEFSSIKGIFLDTVRFPRLTRSIFQCNERLVSKDMKFDEHVKSSSSQDSPPVVQENKKVVVPNTDSESRDESDPGVDEVRLGLATFYPSMQEIEIAHPHIARGMVVGRSTQIFSEGKYTSLEIC